MKHIKRFCLITLTLVLLFTALPIADAAENYIVLYGFAFDINTDGEAVIHSYDDRSTDAVIPQKLMGADVTTIDDYAFFNDANITSVSFEKATALKTIGVNAFNGCVNLKSLTIPGYIEALSFGSFQNCGSLEELIIEDGIAQIPDQCFYASVSLKQIALPQSIEKIGERAFMNCSELSVVDIPDTVEEIADNAFDGCDDLVIRCTKESYALQYAISHEINYLITNPDPITYMIGDADGDGAVTICDVTVIQRALASIEVNAFDEAAADIGNNGLEITDATVIQRYLSGVDGSYRIGEIVTIVKDMVSIE